MTRTSLDVESIASEMEFSNERLRKASSELARDERGVIIVWVDVGGGGKKRRRLKYDNVFRGNEWLKNVYDCVLDVFCLCWGSRLARVCLSGIICERVDDDNVSVVESCLFDFVECLWESECVMGSKFMMRK